jgi:hypothetical protein
MQRYLKQYDLVPHKAETYGSAVSRTDSSPYRRMEGKDVLSKYKKYEEHELEELQR